jgi:16S rRNA (guanine966-N2)-methyltransferase
VRVVGGRFGGRVLIAPAGETTRPSSDRLRQSLFDMLAHGFDDVVADARVLDLFAGTGAFGLEALSRGARYALFVETDAAARGAIRGNIDALGVAGSTRLFRRDATSLGLVGNIQPFDMVFADPPYGAGLGERALSALVAGGWLAEGAVVVLEEAADVEVGAIVGLTLADRRQVGHSQLQFFNAHAPPKATR